MDKRTAEDIAEQTSEFLMNAIESNAKIKIHAIRHSPTTVKFRVEIQEYETREDGVEMTQAARAFIALADATHCTQLGKAGFTAEHLGKEFTTNDGKTFRITGWKDRARVRPITTKCTQDGRIYDWPVKAVAAQLQLKTLP
tara:strand:- start:934 stop:1356 length:423 start_codon:yes stop_codon:yes gene_type:complete